MRDSTPDPFSDRSTVLAHQIGVLTAVLFLVLGIGSVLHAYLSAFGPAGASHPGLAAAYGWWVALGFVGLQVGMGRRICRWVAGRRANSDGIARGLVEFTVGFWMSTVLLMILAALGPLDGPALILYLLVAAGMAFDPQRWGLRELVRRFVPALSRIGWLALKILVVLGLLLLPYLLQTLTPNTDWDGASTHLPLAEWIQEGGLRSIPLAYSNLIMPGSVHLVYALFLGLGAEQAIIPLNLVISLLTCMAAGSLAKRFWGETAGWWAFVVALSTNLILELGLDPRIDGFLAFFSTMAALGIASWILEERSPYWLLLVGVSLGNALGTKYTAVFPLVLWGLPLVLAGVKGAWESRSLSARSVLVLVFCTVIPASYWYLSNTVLLGDPLYPRVGGELMIGADGQPVPMDEAVETLLASAEKGEAYETVLEETRTKQAAYQPPRSLFDLRSLVVEPAQHSRKGGHTLSVLLLLGLLLPAVRRDSAGWLLTWMAWSALLTIGSQTYLVRYGLVFYPLLAAGAGAVLVSVERRWWHLGWAAAALGLISLNLVFEWRRVGEQQVGAWLGGTETHLDWLQQVGYNGSTEMPLMIAAIRAGERDGSVPADGKVLMIGEAKFHLLGFRAFPDISRTGRPWLAYLARSGADFTAVHHALEADGIRYLLVNLGYFGWVRGNLAIDAEEYAYSMSTLREFVETHAEVATSSSGIVLFRLSPVNKGE